MDLRISRSRPSGNASEFSPIVIKFNQQMIKLQTVSGSDRRIPKVKISPPSEGEWRWEDTEMLKFRPKKGFKNDTQYTVTVPKSIKSCSGATLKEDFCFSFKTLPVKITTFEPRKWCIKNQLFLVMFNTTIDPHKIANKIECFGIKNSKIKFKVEVLDIEKVRKIVEEPIFKKQQRTATWYFNEYHKDYYYGQGKIMFFRFKENIPYDAEFKVKFYKQEYTFKSYGKMKYESRYPSESNKPTKNNRTFTYYFSNPIDKDSIDESLFSISPDLPKDKTTQYVWNEKLKKNERLLVDKQRYTIDTNYISVNGNIPVGNSTYQIAFKKIKDVFGQTLESQEDKLKIYPLPYQIRSGYGDFNVIDTSRDYAQMYSVSLLNVKEVELKIYHVDPLTFRDFRSYNSMPSNIKPKYTLVLPTEAKLDEYKVFNFPIEWKYLQNPKNRTGQIVFELQGKSFLSPTPSYYGNKIFRNWFQFTRYSIDSFSFANGISYVYINSLVNGNAVDPKTITLYNSQMKKIESTVENNLIKTDLRGLNSYQIIIAKIASKETGKDDFIVCKGLYANTNIFRESYRSFTFDTKKIFQLGEKVDIKGMIRKIIKNKSGYRVVFPETNEPVTYEVKDSRYQKIKEGKIELSQLGAFTLSIDNEKTVSNLGNYTVSFKFKDYSFYHNFKVEEFKIPKFLVSLNVKPNENGGGKVFYPKDTIKVKVKAKYLDDSPLQNCKANWKIRKSEHYLSPMPGFNFSDYGRGRGRGYYSEDSDEDINTFGSSNSLNFENTTNSKGENEISFTQSQIPTYYPISKGRAVQVSISCDVQDLDNSVIKSSTNQIIYPCKYFVGVKLKTSYFSQGKILPAQFIVVDKDGFAAPNKKFVVEIRSNKKSEPIWTKTIESKLEAIDFIELINKETWKKDIKELNEAGYFTISASIKDELGRTHKSSSSFSINAVKDTGVERIEKEEIMLIANKSKYCPGETAKICVQSPFESNSYSSGVLFGIVEGVDLVKHFKILPKDKNAVVVDVPIKEEYFPNLNLHVSLFGEKTNKNLNKLVPSHGSGSLNLQISNESKLIKLDVQPSKQTYQPGELAKIAIKIKNNIESLNIPKTELAMIVVDKAILSLTNYKLQNPLQFFYPEHRKQLNEYNLRQYIMMKIVEKEGINDKEKCKEEKKKKSKRRRAKQCEKKECEEICEEEDDDEEEECEKEGRGSNEKKKVVTFRKNFNPIAYFNPSLKFNQSGEIDIQFKLPDNLTTFEIWTVVADQGKFGYNSASEIKTDLQFQIEGRFPQFLNFKDEIDLQLLVFNKTKEEEDVEIEVKCINNKLELLNSSKMDIKAPSKVKTKVLIPVRSIALGESKIQVIARCKNSDGLMDSFEEIIEVKRPQTQESFCQYGEIDEEKCKISKAVQIPGKNEVFEDIGGISLNFSSTALQHLTDCFLYLHGYKFNCYEQITSKVLGVLSVGKVLTEFNVPNFPKQKELYDVINTALVKYKNAQLPDGGFGFWGSAKRSYPYVSMYIAFSLCKIKEALKKDEGMKKNIVVPDENVFTKSKNYLFSLRNKKIDLKKDYGYGSRSYYSLHSYVLYILTQYYLIGELSSNEVAKTITRAEEIFKASEDETEDFNTLSVEGLGYVMFTIASLSKEKMNHPTVKIILQKLNNFVNETAQTANFITNFSRLENSIMLSSSKRTDGIMLEILCQLQPKNMVSLIPKIVKGLLGSRIKGKHWNNTQENIFILFGLKRYFEVFEKEVPNFNVGFEFGKNNEVVGSAKFKGRETKNEVFKIPMKEVIAHGKTEGNDISIKKEGKGRCYYRLGIEYSPKNLELDAKDRGFHVEQSYAFIKNKEDVKVDPKTGEIFLKNGELIRVRVKFETETRRYHTALVCSIPSGCVVINPNLKTSVDIPQDHSEDRYSFYPEHVNYRKDRVEAFNTSLSAGKKYFSFVIRAENSGKFIVSPCYVEEMYSPEVFGRFKTQHVNI